MIEKEVYQHFRKEERTFIDQMFDLTRRVEDTYAIQVTDFLDPRQIQIARSVVGQSGLKLFSSSDKYETEYARLIIAPDYYELNWADFEIALLEINYNTKFNQLTHSQVMGSLLHKLGIQRDVFGDIILHDSRVQVLVEQAMVPYFTTVDKIARVKVTMAEVPLEQFLGKTTNDFKEVDILVSSMRLDKLVAAVFKLSRSQATKLVEAEKVKLNYATQTRSSEELTLGDLVSVRGFGRFQVSQDNGLSKNKKHKLSVKKYAKK